MAFNYPIHPPVLLKLPTRPGLRASALYLSLRPVTVGSGRAAVGFLTFRACCCGFLDLQGVWGKTCETSIFIFSVSHDTSEAKYGDVL